MASQRLRGLLDSDRSDANEARAHPAQPPLQTTDSKASLRLRMKRRFRDDPRVRIGSVLASASLVLAMLVGAIDALASARAVETAVSVPTLTSHDIAFVRSMTPLVSHQPSAVAVREAPARPYAVGDRLQRARRVLRRADAEGAAQARVLLEDLLRAKPRNGRAYAALAEACLRLEDAGCARTAATKAVARQPRRVSYRALAARIDRAFDHARASE
jgi:hypothetical protein